MTLTRSRAIAAWCFAIVSTLNLVFYLGCSGSTRHVAVQADRTVFEILNDIHGAEQQALCGRPSCATLCVMTTEPPTCSIPPFVKAWTPAKSKAFNKTLLPAIDGGIAFNETLAAWQPGLPMPPQVPTLIDNLGASLTTIIRDFPPSPQRDAITQNIGLAESLVLSAFKIVLTVKGVQQ